VHARVVCNVLLVICVLEGSGKWPDSTDAIRRLKAAYYLSLSQALGKTAPSVLSAAYTDYLEVYKVCVKVDFQYQAISQLTYISVHVRCWFCYEPPHTPWVKKTRCQTVDDDRLLVAVCCLLLFCRKCCNDLFIANFMLSVTVKGFCKSVNIWRSYWQELGVLFFLTRGVVLWHSQTEAVI